MANEPLFGDNRPYRKQWGSTHPGHIVFLVDLSGSMEDKIDYVIDALHQTCRSISAHCKSNSGPKNRVSVSIYGYNYHIVELLKVDAIGLSKALLEAKKGGRPLFNKKEEAKPEFQTCMKMAFDKAKEDVEQWIAQQKAEGRTEIPSPIVINITDGEPYEGDDISKEDVFEKTRQAAMALMNVSTDDGNVRIFNVHHDPTISDPSLSFPTSQPTINENMAFLYQISSPMYEDLLDSAHTFGFTEATIGSHCMISNEKDVSRVVSFIEWGSSK